MPIMYKGIIELNNDTFWDTVQYFKLYVSWISQHHILTKKKKEKKRPNLSVLQMTLQYTTL